MAIVEIAMMSAASALMVSGTFCGVPQRVPVGLGTAAVSLPFIAHGIWALVAEPDPRRPVVVPVAVSGGGGVAIVGRF